MEKRTFNMSDQIMGHYVKIALKERNVDKKYTA